MDQSTVLTNNVPISVIWDQASKPKCNLILAHGAGVGMTHWFMETLANDLVANDISVLRFNFPYLEEGRKSPDSPKRAQQAIVDVVNTVLKNYPDMPLIVGGKSYGGRMASHCSAQGSIPAVKGLVFFGFPLHAPGRDSAERAGHLAQCSAPMLFLQGTNDKLANINLIKEVCKGLGNKASLIVYEGADHSFKVPKKLGMDPADMVTKLANDTSSWIDRLLA